MRLADRARAAGNTSEAKLYKICLRADVSPAVLALCGLRERRGRDLEPFAPLTLLSVRADEGHAGKSAALAPAGNTSS